MVTLTGHWHAEQVCSSQINPGFKCTGQDGIVWRCVGEQFADVIMVNRVPYGGGGVMVWAGIRYGQQKQQHFIDGNSYAQTYRDEILWPIVVPFIRHHHLMFQHDKTRPHDARICTQFLESENVPVLPWPAYSTALSL